MDKFKPGDRVVVKSNIPTTYQDMTGTITRYYVTDEDDAWLVRLDQNIPWPYGQEAPFDSSELEMWRAS